MELLTILLSGLMTLISPVGLVVDRVAENAIRSQFQSVERLQVRVDNPPSHQLLQGRVERLRIAGRGLVPRPGMRIAALDLETDPIAIAPASLRGGQPPQLQEPVQAGVRLVLDQADLNRILQAPWVTERLRNLSLSLTPTPQPQLQRYDLLNPRVEFLSQDRLRFLVELQEQGDPERLLISLETGLQLVGGRRIRLVDPLVQVDNEAAPPQLFSAIIAGIEQRFDLRNLEDAGVVARLLQLQVVPGQQIELAGFVRLEPRSLSTLLNRP